MLQPLAVFFNIEKSSELTNAFLIWLLPNLFLSNLKKFSLLII